MLPIRRKPLKWNLNDFLNQKRYSSISKPCSVPFMLMTNIKKKNLKNG